MTRTLLNALVCLFPVALLAPAVQADATLTMKDVGGKDGCHYRGERPHGAHVDARPVGLHAV